MSQQHRPGRRDVTKWLIFKVRKAADNNWQVWARLGSRHESQYVANFNSELQALEWIAGNQSDEWLKDRAARRRQAGSG